MTNGFVTDLRALFVASLAAFAACSDPESAADEERPPLAAAVMRVRHEAAFSLRQFASGEVRARRRVQLAFQRGGRIEQLDVDVGDRVEQDAELARLDEDQILAQQRSLRAALQAAEAVMQELDAGPRVEVIEAARARRREAEANVTLRKLELDRARELLTREIDSQARVDTAQAAHDGAVANLAAASATLAELEAGTRAEQLAAQAARVAQLEADLSAVEVDLRWSRLVAPFAGTVVARHVDDGAIVNVGSPVVELIESDHLEAWIRAPESMARQLKGSTTELILDSGPLRVEAPRIVGDVDAATRTVQLVFDLGSTEAARPGSLVRLGLDRQIEERGVWIPTTALTESRRGLWSCYVAEPATGEHHRVTAADVQVVHVGDDRTYVRGTLDDGDLVIVGGLQRLAIGSTVIVREADQERR